MSKVNELIKKMCSDGVEYHKLNELLDYIQPSKYIVKNTNYDKNYTIPVLTAGKTFILGYTNETEGIYRASKEKPVIIFDDFTTSNHWVDFDFKVKSSAMKILVPKTNDSFKFIYYCMQNIKYIPKEHSRQWIQKYSEFKIPLPKKEIQEKIVEILDRFSKLGVELETELEARKKQYEFYSKKIFAFKQPVKYVPIGEISSTITDYVANGSFAEIAKNVQYKSQPDYAVLIRTVDYSNGFNPDKFVYIDKDAYSFLKKSKLFGGEIIINNVGAGVGTTFLCPKLDINMSLAPNSIMIKTSNNRFYYHWLKSIYGQEAIKKIVSKSALPKFNKTEFRKIMVPILPKQQQNEIVNILDKIDNFINNISEGLPAEIELRKKQYEYYRDKLLNLKEVIE